MSRYDAPGGGTLAGRSAGVKVVDPRRSSTRTSVRGYRLAVHALIGVRDAPGPGLDGARASSPPAPGAALSA